MSAAKKWKHDELALDLAGHLRGDVDRMVWTNMQMGPSGSPRPDVFTMQKSYSAPRPISYEIKISESDLRGDITKGKWQTYLPFSSGVYFAFPAGMVPHELIPKACGIIVRHEQVWRSARKPALNPVQLSQDAMLKLLIDGVDRAHAGIRIRQANDWLQEQAIRKKHGKEAAEVLNDLRGARDRAERVKIQAEEYAKREHERVNRDVAIARDAETALLREICDALGIKHGEDPGYVMRNARSIIAERLANLQADVLLRRAEEELSWLRNGLERAIRAVTIERPSDIKEAA